MRSSSLLSGLALVLSSPAVLGADWRVGQVVQTTSGMVEGHAAPDASEVSEYLGIPYAQPPVGSLRWQPPVKYTGGGSNNNNNNNNNTVINGTAWGNSCHQLRDILSVGNNILGITPQGLNLLEFIVGDAKQDEDCLVLNVWTKPQTGDEKKAVLVWVHGGSFTTGTASMPFYSGQHMANTHDVIVVGINYRLNILGFPGSPTGPYNLGLQDQRLAVEWVRDNIASFGGDPGRIVLFGESAGGASVDYYSYAHTSDTIVAGVIPQSGTATGFGQLTKSSAATSWFKVTAMLGCGDATTTTTTTTTGGGAQEAMDCMMQKPADEIIAKVNELSATEAADPESNLSQASQGLQWGPVIDDIVVFSNYSSRSPAPIPVLIGNLDDEAGLLQIFYPSIPPAAWKAINAASFVCPAASRAVVNVKAGNPTWRYRYFGTFPNLRLTDDWSIGAWHGSELPVLFNTTPTNVVDNTEAQREIGNYMAGAWAAFAKDPVNGLLGYMDGWPRFSTEENTLVRLGWRNQTGINASRGGLYDVGCGTEDVESPTGTVTMTTTATSEATGEGGLVGLGEENLAVRGQPNIELSGVVAMLGVFTLFY